jgi:hypothetical protein
MRILMVHGRAQAAFKPEDLVLTWTDTLKAGFVAAKQPWPSRVEIDFPYYATVLDAFAARAGLPTQADLVAKGAGGNAAYEQFMQSALDQIKDEAAITDVEVQAHLDPTAPQQKGIQNRWWFQAIVRAIDARLGAVTNFTIEKALTDVFVYVTYPAVRKQINAIIEAKLTAEPTIVIGHSLGSVVAYDVIMKNRAQLDLVKFVTVGSPLGIRAISSKLGVLQNPAGANGWYNAYDERDVVALNPLDNRFFPVTPSIKNYNSVRNSTDNRHGIVGYLDDPDVAAHVAAALA